MDERDERIFRYLLDTYYACILERSWLDYLLVLICTNKHESECNHLTVIYVVDSSDWLANRDQVKSRYYHRQTGLSVVLPHSFEIHNNTSHPYTIHSLPL